MARTHVYNSQKYAHMLAERWGMKIHTRALKGRNEPAYMFITERA